MPQASPPAVVRLLGLNVLLLERACLSCGLSGRRSGTPRRAGFTCATLGERTPSRAVSNPIQTRGARTAQASALG